MEHLLSLMFTIIREIVLWFVDNRFYIHLLFNFLLVIVILLNKRNSGRNSDDNHGNTPLVSENVCGASTDDDSDNEREHLIIDIESYDEDSDEDYCCRSDDDDDVDSDNGSDGYDEDDDNDGLRRRSDKFIAKMHNGWREEGIRDKMMNC
ncbi:phosphopantothenoylcysteine decarboxylase subunit VHS3-like [Chenopodium quinoa]|uniref:phosphopantothenoylcysteine decarboxylase subunit VHS3-like n=1 Tax=Chenopodium quinoa TaxID=63459 RepID=UPI000B78387F|nr:phosphopantothenoylcysteine decarboxylase subunit VHS3-like [Chenopodium quinoa]